MMDFIIDPQILQFGIYGLIGLFLLRNRIKKTLKQLLRRDNIKEIKLRGPIKETKDSWNETAISSSNVLEKLDSLKTGKYDALIININTPGGSPVPSDDIRRKLEELDLPVYTYTRSLCASGGYMIACGTEYIHARQDSMIGSIGVIGSQYKLTGLADKIGIEYERFVGGDHKDTHRPLKELDDEERSYWQSVIDQSYENFVEVVSDARDLPVEEVKNTEAEVFNSKDALEKGLVDSAGSREDLKQVIKDREGLSKLKIKQSNGGNISFNRVDALFSSFAYSLGKGLSSSLVKSKNKPVEYKM